jgi:hypothetical protein
LIETNPILVTMRIEWTDRTAIVRVMNILLGIDGTMIRQERGEA